MKTSLTEEEKQVREILIEVASRKGIITYSELINKARLSLDMSSPYDRGLIGHLLGSVSVYEAGRPMLSSVVVSADGVQGDGLY